MVKTDSESAYYEAFRQRLKEFRAELNYSQTEMAQALGMTKANYQKYEDRSKFPLHKMEALALVTRKPLHFIVTGRKPKTGHLSMVPK